MFTTKQKEIISSSKNFFWNIAVIAFISMYGPDRLINPSHNYGIWQIIYHFVKLDKSSRVIVNKSKVKEISVKI